MSGFRHGVSDFLETCRATWGNSSVSGGQSMAYFAVAFILIFHVTSIWFAEMGIPPTGYPKWAGPYYGAVRFYFASQKMIQEGHMKYGERGIFKIPRWTGWLIIVDSDQLVSEMYHIAEDMLSARDSNYDENQTKYTLGESIYTNTFHVPLLRSKLTRHIDYLGQECLEELTYAFEEVIGRKLNESWKEFNVVEPLTKVMARTSGRFVVGQPLCRSEGYTAMALQSGPEIIIRSFFINLFPSLLKPVIGHPLGNLRAKTRNMIQYLEPEIQDRRACISKDEKDWSDKHNDILSWFLEAAPPEEQSSEALARRVMAVNAAAFHSLSMSLLHALMNLALRPEYVHILRAEVEEVIRVQGWSKNAIDQLPKLDSFVKETLRFNVIGSTSIPRKAREPLLLSDGTYIPKGSYVASAWSNHFDEQHYSASRSFDGLRFYKEMKSIGKGKVNEVVRTTPYYQTFGHGKHACEATLQPGRFIASYILKGALAHILLNYDVKMGGDGTRPPDIWFMYFCSPSRNIPMYFKRRT